MNCNNEKGCGADVSRSSGRKSETKLLRREEEEKKKKKTGENVYIEIEHQYMHPFYTIRQETKRKKMRGRERKFSIKYNNNRDLLSSRKRAEYEKLIYMRFNLIYSFFSHLLSLSSSLPFLCSNLQRVDSHSHIANIIFFSRLCESLEI
jgi:ribosomal protein L31